MSNDENLKNDRPKSSFQILVYIDFFSSKLGIFLIISSVFIDGTAERGFPKVVSLNTSESSRYTFTDKSDAKPLFQPQGQAEVQGSPIKSSFQAEKGLLPILYSTNSFFKDKTEEDEEAARLKEILKNYRDRAAERRDKGDNDVCFTLVLN